MSVKLDPITTRLTLPSYFSLLLGASLLDLFPIDGICAGSVSDSVWDHCNSTPCRCRGAAIRVSRKQSQFALRKGHGSHISATSYTLCTATLFLDWIDMGESNYDYLFKVCTSQIGCRA